MSMLLAYAKTYRREIFGQLFFATIWVASQLVIPRLMVDIIDYGILMADMSAIIRKGLLMLLATVINIGSLLVSIFYLTQANAGISRDLRRDLFDKVIDWSHQTRQQYSNSTLITRTVNDVKQVYNFIDLSLRKIYTLTITIIGSLILAFSLDVQLASIMLMIVPVVLVLARFLVNRSMPLYKCIRESIDDINRIFRENLTGIRVVKAFNKTSYEEHRFQEAAENAYAANVKAESMMMLMSPLVQLFTNFMILIILYIGGVRAESGAIRVGILIAIIEYVTMVLRNIQQFASIITVIPRSQSSINRIREVINTQEELDWSQTGAQLDPANYEIRLQDVDFYYPGSHIAALEDINLTIPRGTSQAIIGSTGSGKSTLIRMISRDFDVDEGSVSIQGQDVINLSQDQLQGLVTVIPQTSFLFAGTIRENIQVGKADASDQEIWRVLDMSQMGDFFRSSDQGLDTHIAQNAVNLSGGQKQRISIARGLIRDTDFYIFDDCFSAIDYTTELKIRQAIKEELAEKGIIVVAQRITTVADADSIAVMDNGRIIDQGSHQELAERSRIYQEIIASQVKTEEVSA